jgi:4-nitrophenyl phosphatase
VYISTVLKLPKSSKVYVVGMSGLEHELATEGISHLGGSSPSDNTLEPFDLSTFEKDTSVKAVLCGLDTSINYTKLSKAFQYLLDEDVIFLATNMDSTYPSNGGMLPGAGSLTSVLANATKRTPTSIGKPGKVMLDCIKAK